MSLCLLHGLRALIRPALLPQPPVLAVQLQCFSSRAESCSFSRSQLVYISPWELSQVAISFCADISAIIVNENNVWIYLLLALKRYTRMYIVPATDPQYYF